PAAHPNARFTAPTRQCPILSPAIDDPKGVPISGIIFGGRRASLEPLVYEALDWAHGTFLGASLSSEMTAAAKGVMGQLRHDPFAMLPFCGYNMGDYFSHWLSMEAKMTKLPKIFHVNWFKKDATGKFLWPGYGENARVLQWMFARVSGRVEAKRSPIGWLPHLQDLDRTGLALPEATWNKLLAIDKEEWKQEVEELKRYFTLFGKELPEGIHKQLQALEKRLSE
ncbi:MAG: phosphoenolpyruvate carboxykinase (GTP), partial [Chlamydiae bacterium]|nr:phosphoenolpyruvate carboxykinase (GTP) [Chlamydiota bacterium]